jgi:hypothetical protein
MIFHLRNTEFRYIILHKNPTIRIPKQSTVLAKNTEESQQSPAYTVRLEALEALPAAHGV